MCNLLYHSLPQNSLKLCHALTDQGSLKPKLIFFKYFDERLIFAQYPPSSLKREAWNAIVDI